MRQRIRTALQHRNISSLPLHGQEAGTVSLSPHLPRLPYPHLDRQALYPRQLLHQVYVLFLCIGHGHLAALLSLVALIRVKARSASVTRMERRVGNASYASLDATDGGTAGDNPFLVHVISLIHGDRLGLLHHLLRQPSFSNLPPPCPRTLLYSAMSLMIWNLEPPHSLPSALPPCNL